MKIFVLIVALATLAYSEPLKRPAKRGLFRQQEIEIESIQQSLDYSKSAYLPPPIQNIPLGHERSAQQFSSSGSNQGITQSNPNYHQTSLPNSRKEEFYQPTANGFVPVSNDFQSSSVNPQQASYNAPDYLPPHHEAPFNYHAAVNSQHHKINENAKSSFNAVGYLPPDQSSVGRSGENIGKPIQKSSAHIQPNFAQSGPSNFAQSRPSNTAHSGPSNLAQTGPSSFGQSRPSNFAQSRPSNFAHSGPSGAGLAGGSAAGYLPPKSPVQNSFNRLPHQNVIGSPISSTIYGLPQHAAQAPQPQNFGSPAINSVVHNQDKIVSSHQSYNLPNGHTEHAQTYNVPQQQYQHNHEHHHEHHHENHPESSTYDQPQKLSFSNQNQGNDGYNYDRQEQEYQNHQEHAQPAYNQPENNYAANQQESNYANPQQDDNSHYSSSGQVRGLPLPDKYVEPAPPEIPSTQNVERPHSQDGYLPPLNNEQPRNNQDNSYNSEPDNAYTNEQESEEEDGLNIDVRFAPEPFSYDPYSQENSNSYSSSGIESIDKFSATTPSNPVPNYNDDRHTTFTYNRGNNQNQNTNSNNVNNPAGSNPSRVQVIRIINDPQQDGVLQNGQSIRTVKIIKESSNGNPNNNQVRKIKIITEPQQSSAYVPPINDIALQQMRSRSAGVNLPEGIKQNSIALRPPSVHLQVPHGNEQEQISHENSQQQISHGNSQQKNSHVNPQQYQHQHQHQHHHHQTPHQNQRNILPPSNSNQYLPPKPSTTTTATKELIRIVHNNKSNNNGRSNQQNQSESYTEYDSNDNVDNEITVTHQLERESAGRYQYPSPQRYFSKF